MSGSISSRPSLEQVVAIVNFMEKHPALALGKLRGVEGREEGKKLWQELTMIVNGILGPTRPMKSWIKYWADKKSSIRAKVQSGKGDANILCSNIEKKIWDLFLASDTRTRSSVKQESQHKEDFNHEDSTDQNHVVLDDVVLALDEPVLDMEDQQTAIMDKLVQVMTSQASAMSQLAYAAQLSSQAVERLAEASQIQARAIDRLANTFETITSATHDVSNAMVDIDTTMKRFYTTSPT